jgi:hypothetical protein
MGRDREYDSDAERQRAYRERKKLEQEALREALRQSRRDSAPGARPPREGRRLTDANLVTLARALALIMHPATDPGQRATAINVTNNLTQKLGVSWYDVLGVREKSGRSR